nr:hypothetical protein [Klebsiella pneumoniae]
MLLFFPELIPHHLPECFRILVKPFAGGTAEFGKNRTLS